MRRAVGRVNLKTTKYWPRKPEHGSQKSGYAANWSQKSGHKVAKVLKMCVQTFATHVQTFATKFWYVLTFATQGATHVQTFKLKMSVRLCNLGW